MAKTNKEICEMRRLRAKIKARGLPYRIEQIVARDLHRCKTPGRDPLDGLVHMGRLKGRKVC